MSEEAIDDEPTGGADQPAADAPPADGTADGPGDRAPDDRTPDDRTPDPETDEQLRARIEVLETEIERLRAEYARARQTQYRRTAVALAALGLVAIGGAVVFPSVRPTLLAVGSIGVFGGVLTYYLTPERFVAATVGERLYRAVATNYAAIAADLGLTDERLYVPRGDAADNTRLFVPESTSYRVPDAEALETPFVVASDERDRGLAIRPIGTELYGEFEQSLTGPLATEIADAAAQLADALVAQFELVDATDASVADDQLTVAIDASVYGDLDRFDHPVVSFLAVGVAQVQSRPVAVDVAEGDDRFGWIVTLRWDDDTSD